MDSQCGFVNVLGTVNMSLNVADGNGKLTDDAGLFHSLLNSQLVLPCSANENDDNAEKDGSKQQLNFNHIKKGFLEGKRFAVTLPDGRRAILSADQIRSHLNSTEEDKATDASQESDQEDSGCQDMLSLSVESDYRENENAISRPFTCESEGCDRAFKTVYRLRLHERIHDVTKQLHCDFEGCDRVLQTHYALTAHNRIHTGEMPYQCSADNCSKTFRTSSDLVKHKRIHTGEKPHRCRFDGCGKMFRTTSVRKVHERGHTADHPFICPELNCGKSFLTQTNFKNHLRIHVGEKPYQCSYEGCEKAFTEYSTLRKHRAAHGRFLFNCVRCPRRFRNLLALTSHQSHHNQEDDLAQGVNGRSAPDGCSAVQPGVKDIMLRPAPSSIPVISAEVDSDSSSMEQVEKDLQNRVQVSVEVDGQCFLVDVVQGDGTAMPAVADEAKHSEKEDAVCLVDLQQAFHGVDDIIHETSLQACDPDEQILVVANAEQFEMIQQELNRIDMANNSRRDELASSASVGGPSDRSNLH